MLALALGAFPGAAGAACPDLPTSMVFAPWGDTGDYFLATGGDFEGPRTSWTGGGLMGGNDPFYLAGGGDRQSLRIEEGATATSPMFCADVRHPDFRFVARPLNPYNPGSLDVLGPLPRQVGRRRRRGRCGRSRASSTGPRRRACG